MRTNAIRGVLENVVGAINHINAWLAIYIRWLLYVLMIIIVYDVVLRYIFRAPTAWSFHISYMIGGTICVMGAAYTLQINKHVSIDIISRLFPIRTRSIINTILMGILFFPSIFLITRYSWIRAIQAWSILEKGSYGFWYPPLYPYRTIIAIGFTLLLIQGLVVFIRDIYFLVKNENL